MLQEFDQLWMSIVIESTLLQIVRWPDVMSKIIGSRATGSEFNPGRTELWDNNINFQKMLQQKYHWSSCLTFLNFHLRVNCNLNSIIIFQNFLTFELLEILILWNQKLPSCPYCLHDITNVQLWLIMEYVWSLNNGDQFNYLSNSTNSACHSYRINVGTPEFPEIRNNCVSS